MEHPLTLHRELNIGIIVCLNPCCNGTPSDEMIANGQPINHCLNPCSNGIPSDLSKLDKDQKYMVS